MITLVVEHDLGEWSTWKPVFDEHAAVRKSHGCLSEELFRAPGEGRTILNVMRWPDRASAEGFLADPSLGDAFRRAGVVGTPRVSFWETAQTQEF